MYLVIRDSSDNTKVYWDGDNSTAAVTATNADDLSWPYLMRGQSVSYALSGDYYECGFWKSDLSTADRNALITYANTKYGSGRNADDTDDLARLNF
jgi:hypothetical protein